MVGFGKDNPIARKYKLSKNGSMLLESAVIAHKAGDIVKAESLYLSAIDSGFHHEIAFSNLGVIYKNTNRIEQAISIYKQAILSNPQFADAYLNLGNLLAEQGSLDEALAITLQSLELSPNNPTAHINMGNIYLALGKTSQSRTSSLKALSLKPGDHYALVNLGISYTRDSDYEKALSIFEEALDIKKTASVMINLSKTYNALGQKEKALCCAKNAVELDEFNEKCQINLAEIYQIYGMFNQGIEAALKAIELNNKSEDNYLLASSILCKSKLFPIARQILERAKTRIEHGHRIEGELVRVKYLEGVLDDTHEKEPWNDEDDFYFEDCNGTNLVISFGSNGRLRDDENNIPLFDFKGVLSELKSFDKLFIRDLDRQYYLNGIKNSAPSIRELQGLIQKYIRSKKYNHVITIGASSGGFGAILYGNLINADCMIAFNPQTVLDEKKETIIKDNILCVPTSKLLANRNRQDPFYRKCLNLKNFIPFQGKAIIHYSDNSLSGIDKRYAEYIEHDNCSLVAHKSTTHLLALQLKEKNELISQIIRSINLLNS